MPSSTSACTRSATGRARASVTRRSRTAALSAFPLVNCARASSTSWANGVPPEVSAWASARTALHISPPVPQITPSHRTALTVTSLGRRGRLETLGPRESHRKRRTPPRATDDVDPPAVRLGNPLGDGESQPRAGTLTGTRARRIGAPEAIEDVRQVSRGDADSGIGHAEGDPAVREAQLHAHGPARGSVLHGVGEEVQDQLADAGGVDRDDDRLGRRRDLHPHPRLFGEQLASLAHLFDDPSQVHGLTVQRGNAFVGPRQPQPRPRGPARWRGCGAMPSAARDSVGSASTGSGMRLRPGSVPSGVPSAPGGRLEAARQEIRRMTELVAALLTLARADEGIAPL